MTECTIFGEDVTFGTDAFFSVAEGCKVWIPENSNTQTSAEENGIVYYLIKDDASVAEQSVYINGAAVSAGEGIVVANEDTISVKYELITADDEEKELFFAFLRFGENGKFLGLKQCEVKTLKNSQSVVEESFEVTDEKQIKAILFSSIQDIKAMCAAVNFFVGE